MATFTLRLPDDLAASVDALKGDVSRTRWIQRVLEREVARAASRDLAGSNATDEAWRTMVREHPALGTARNAARAGETVDIDLPGAWKGPEPLPFPADAEGDVHLTERRVGGFVGYVERAGDGAPPEGTMVIVPEALLSGLDTPDPRLHGCVIRLRP